MATLHVRGVPDDVHAALKARAAREGRSLNAEAIAALRESLLRRRTLEEVLDSIERRRKRIAWPPDAPSPEEIIRGDRDSR